ncbi:PadR family transcriptional regulator [Bailinhaonella thermotolerans]|uniref:PadR family transcriptional regulator n=1 Tax=Bailinhaonella thermotolerans TaxID=1070861 RepID=A0A3A4ACI8_9ACTN|nr:PadR family transcriptional regulator [Bailinhaonella thermotolerans]RJL23263.1 PadR family transcriptional regulator [Bailinhaonella thermotolerans]
MHIDYVILGMLALRRFAGYDLRRWMEGPGRYIGFRVQLPHIYRRLAALVEKGWVEFDVDPRDGRPDAKIYRLTEAGKQALLDWARSPYEPSSRPMDPDFKIRFVFGGQLDPEIAISVVRTELEYRQKHDLNPTFALFESQEAEIPELDPAWARQIHTLAHEHGYASTASYVAWLQLTLNRLEASRRS